VCDALATTEAECSQRTVRQSTTAALIPAADTHTPPTLEEMTRMLTVMQSYLADTFLTQTQVDW